MAQILQTVLTECSDHLSEQSRSGKASRKVYRCERRCNGPELMAYMCSDEVYGPLSIGPLS